MGSFTSCLSGDAPAGDERSGKPGITANGDGEISTLGNLRSAVSATGPGVPERMECSRVVESQWASSAQQLGTTLALLRLVSPASLSKLGTLTLAEAISTLVCVSTRNSGQQQVISDEEVMVVLRSEWTEEAMLLQQTPNYPMPSASAQHGHAFLQVVQAAGPWSAGGVLSLAQQCTLRMRMELANVNSNEALGSAVTSWKQGVQGVVVLPRGAGTLHFRSAYVEDADGVLAPSLLVRLASTAPPPTLTPGPSPLPQPRLLGPHSTGRVLKKDPSIRSMGIKLDRKAVMQLALGEVLAAPAPDAGRQGSFDANGSSDVFGLMDAVTAANESSVSGVLAVMAPTLHRLHSILSNVPLIISLLDPNGGVIFQNDLSRSYWGNLATELGDTGPRAMEMLEAVLSAEPGLVEEVMENIAHGILWKKVLRVPLVCGLTRGAVEPIFEPMETEEGGTETDVGASSGVSFDVQTPPAGPEFGGPAASSPDASSRSIVGSTLFAPTVPSPGIRAAFASDPHSTRSSALPETASTSANANAFDETIRSGALPRPRGGTNFMSFVDYGPKSCDVRSAEIGSAVQPSAKLLSIMMPKASPSKGATRVSDSGIDRPSGQAYKPSPAARARNGGMSMDYGPRSEALAKIVEKPVSGGAIRGGSDGQLFGGVGTRDPATLEVLLQCGSVDDPGAPDSANNSCSQVPAVVGLGTSAAPTYQSQRSLDEASAEMIKPGDNVGSLLELQQWTFQQAVSHEAGAVRRGERELWKSR
ncbi:hypothetical protein FOA52_014272 [Chlamydomonas sp. UWO 241]|nr:hypothetical protein FOA52_014272 [Chlamydomonas sp. UWO 241]